MVSNRTKVVLVQWLPTTHRQQEGRASTMVTNQPHKDQQDGRASVMVTNHTQTSKQIVVAQWLSLWASSSVVMFSDSFEVKILYKWRVLPGRPNLRQVPGNTVGNREDWQYMAYVAY